MAERGTLDAWQRRASLMWEKYRKVPLAPR
jgi:hypothetical protein